MNGEETHAKSKMCTWKTLAIQSIRNTHINNNSLIIIQVCKEDELSFHRNYRTAHLNV